MVKTGEKNKWFLWIKIILLGLFIALLLRTFVFSTSLVQGESMYPTLQNGDRLLFNKLIYLTEEPSRGDIVIIKRPLKNYVKRVIALPNETIEVKDHVLRIDGIPYNQNFLTKSQQMHSANFRPIKVPPNSYFVMGDNRPISRDSRNGLGFVFKDEIIGKSELIIFPFSEWSVTR
ncbi:signal peptidase I [Aquibacillus salsiterrae]|uniref:Signal peptidase I n=1 Tax=Aquibacillus salsiterrae TaxID=2950439 RepID=A0A9X3WFM5_9BACI|nr:signal peptidase I [Aquibacillus salsiterrae]MDC3416554.1 signal peptidase I [Aquibacillus salsiterrae]